MWGQSSGGVWAGERSEAHRQVSQATGQWMVGEKRVWSECGGGLGQNSRDTPVQEMACREAWKDRGRAVPESGKESPETHSGAEERQCFWKEEEVSS